MIARTKEDVKRIHKKFTGCSSFSVFFLNFYTSIAEKNSMIFFKTIADIFNFFCSIP